MTDENYSNIIYRCFYYHKLCTILSALLHLDNYLNYQGIFFNCKLHIHFWQNVLSNLSLALFCWVFNIQKSSVNLEIFSDCIVSKFHLIGILCRILCFFKNIVHFQGRSYLLCHKFHNMVVNLQYCILDILYCNFNTSIGKLIAL